MNANWWLQTADGGQPNTLSTPGFHPMGTVQQAKRGSGLLGQDASNDQSPSSTLLEDIGDFDSKGRRKVMLMFLFLRDNFPNLFGQSVVA